MKNLLKKLLSLCLVAAIAAVSVPPQAMARIVATEEAAESMPAAVAIDRATLLALLGRDDVRSRLESLGVDPAETSARVAALTDEQVRELAGRIDGLPAGGTSFFGLLLGVFIVLIITDVLGFTRVFPFTRTIR